MPFNSQIIGASPNFDCFLTFVEVADANPQLNIYQLNSGATTIANAVNLYTLVNGDRSAE